MLRRLPSFLFVQFPRPTGRARLSSAGGLLARVCLSQQYLRNAAHVGGISGRGLRGFFAGVAGGGFGHGCMVRGSVRCVHAIRSGVLV